jgi:hypothetical protein
MNAQQWTLAAVNIVGGILVLGSYAHGLVTHPDNRGALWGGVPDSIQPLNAVFMLMAAAGYLAFTHYILFRLGPGEVRIADRFGFWLFDVIYALILLPSALWMPLTYAMIEDPSDGLWWAIRITLAVVGLGSVALLAVLLSLRPSQTSVAYWLAIAGSCAFCLQTAIMDAIVWSVFFRS